MQELIATDTAVAQTQQIINQILKSWAAQNKSVSTYFSKYEDDIYLRAVAPGSNRAIYLLGHLASTNDGLFPLFGLGERLYPQLEAMFSTNPDKTFAEIPSLNELKQYWEIINAKLADHFSKMTPDQWLERHIKVSEEDFKLDPMRNKLNVLMSRTTHQSYHAGQLALLKG